MPPRRYLPRRPPRPQRRKAPVAAAVEAAAAVAARPEGPVELPSSVAVKDLAEALGVSHADIIKELIRNGIFATINQTIDFDTASLVAGELGFETVERGATERAAAEAASRRMAFLSRRAFSSNAHTLSKTRCANNKCSSSKNNRKKIGSSWCINILCETFYVKHSM